MKFPKSVHAEGWATHLETTKPEHLPDALKDGIHAPLHAAKAPPGGTMRMNTPQRVTPEMSTVPPVAATAASTPRIDPQPRPQVQRDVPRAQPTHAATLPPRNEGQRNWMVAAGAGAAVIAALAVWAVNRPAHDSSSTAPAAVTGSAEPQPTQPAPATDVAAATPTADAAASQPSDTGSATTTADATAANATTTTAAADTSRAGTAPATLGKPVTTVKPAPESRTLAQATVPAPRPDLVVRADPRAAAEPTPSPALQPRPSAALQPSTSVAAAPAPELQPQGVPQGNAPIVMPPTAAGPATALTPPATTAQPLPQQAIPPVAAATPDATASATSPGTPPLAQATPQVQQQAQVQPPSAAPEDAGITQQVRVALASEATLAGVPIAVSTDHGIVKLEGQAPDAQARARATVVAASTSGVKAVDNRLTLPPSPVVSQAPTGAADGL